MRRSAKSAANLPAAPRVTITGQDVKSRAPEYPGEGRRGLERLERALLREARFPQLGTEPYRSPGDRLVRCRFHRCHPRICKPEQIGPAKRQGISCLIRRVLLRTFGLERHSSG